MFLISETIYNYLFYCNESQSLQHLAFLLSECSCRYDVLYRIMKAVYLVETSIQARHCTLVNENGNYLLTSLLLYVLLSHESIYTTPSIV